MVRRVEQPFIVRCLVLIQLMFDKNNINLPLSVSFSGLALSLSDMTTAMTRQRKGN
jgi:hypothetical protein